MSPNGRRVCDSFDPAKGGREISHNRQLADVSLCDHRTSGGNRRPLVKMERSDILANVRVSYEVFTISYRRCYRPFDLFGLSLVKKVISRPSGSDILNEVSPHELRRKAKIIFWFCLNFSHSFQMSETSSESVHPAMGLYSSGVSSSNVALPVSNMTP